MALLACLTFAIIESPRGGWGSGSVLVPLAVAVVSLVALLGYEPRRSEPLIEFRFFRSIPFSAATLTAVCAFGGYSGFLFLNTLYLQDVRGLSPLHAGLVTTPMAAMVLICAPLSGRIVGTRGPRLSLLGAGAGMIIGAALLLGLTTSTSYGLLIASYTVFAAGFGLVNPPITNTAVSGMPRSQAGVAAAFASTSRQIGASLGVAVIGSLINTGASAHVGAGLVPKSHAAEAIVVGCGVAVALLGLVSTTRRAHRTAEATAATLGSANTDPEPLRTAA
jgi:predicted MFS family arabinose efflux permease